MFSFVFMGSIPRGGNSFTLRTPQFVQIFNLRRNLLRFNFVI